MQPSSKNSILLSKNGRLVCKSVWVCVAPVPEDVGGIGAPNSRGAEEAHRALPTEALYGDLRILGLSIPAYLHWQWQPG